MRNHILVLVCALTLWASSVRSETLTIWRDCSSSMSEADLADVVPGAVTFVQSEERIDRVDLIPFSCAVRRTFTEPTKVFDFGVTPTKPAPKRTGGLSDWFVVGVEAADTEATTRYEDLLRTFRTQRLAAAQDLNNALRAQPNGSAACTRFDSLAIRIAEEDRPFNLVFTDAWFDCHIAAPKLPRMSGHIAIVLLPRNSDPASHEVELFAARSKAIQTLFPDAAVVKPFQLQRILSNFWK